jgi:excisionase family DNA binding protein
VKRAIRLETMPDLITVDEAADWLGCSVVTVRRLIRAGTLTRVKVGRLDRIPRTALERMREGL